jgi:hypothetical protein
VENQIANKGACDDATPIIAIRTRADELTGSRITVARSRIKSNHSIPYRINRTPQKGIDNPIGLLHIANRYAMPDNILITTNYTVSGLLDLL